MSDRSDPADFSPVYEAEIEEIIKRRRAAGFWVPDEEDAARRAVCERVGLGLSGGGIRSAAFNLGLLQALDAKGVLRHVDYLSTVSGGGYVGGLMASLARYGDAEGRPVSHQEGAKDQAAAGASQPGGPAPQPGEQGAADHDDSKNRPSPPPLLLPGLAPQEDRSQPPRVRRLIRGGMYLNRPWRFMGRYFVGWMAVNTVVFSFLLAVVTALAIVFRCLDLRSVIRVCYALGFRTDVGRAFVPSLSILAALILASVVSYGVFLATGKRVLRRTRTLLFFLLLAASVMALAALLGTGDIFLAGFLQAPGSDLDKAEIMRIQNYLMIGLFIAVAVGLLPYLRPKDLIRSATRPRSPLERWVFNIASYALLLGIPLSMFGVVARENISGYNESQARYGDLSIEHIGFNAWERFLERVQSEALASRSGEQQGTQGGLVPAGYALSREIWDATDGQDPKSHELADAIIQDHEKVDRWNDRPGFLGLRERWQRFEEVWRAFGRLDENKKTFVEVLNREFLKDPDFYKYFADYETSTDAEKKQLWEAACLAGRVYRIAEKGATDADLSDELKELKLANWALLRSYYGPETIHRPTTVFAYVVTRFQDADSKWTWGADQLWRFRFMLVCLGVFLVAGLFVNLNATSIHGFYRDQLAKMWIGEPVLDGPASAKAAGELRLKDLNATERGLPYQLVNCTLNFFRGPYVLLLLGLPGKRALRAEAPSARFVLAKRYCGSDQLGFAKTEEYMGGKYDLANAMAVSGAAVSPSLFGNLFVAFLLLLFNFRLGQWLENPGKRTRRGGGSARPRPRFRLPPATIPVAFEHLFRGPDGRRYCFITDGGHHENLGVEPLLKRRCRVVIVSDAGADPECKLEELLRVIRRNRIDDGILFYGIGRGRQPLVLDPLIPHPETKLSDCHFLVAKIRYPSAGYLGPGENLPRGYLVYLKSSFDGDEEADLIQYRKCNPEFPHDSTLDQFYDECRFESYRQLGYHIASRVCKALFSGVNKDPRQPLLAREWSPPKPALAARTAAPAGDEVQPASG